MKILVAALFVTCQVLSPTASAQDKTRAEVKAEAARALKAGEIPRGEGVEPKAEPRKTFTQDEKAAARANRKAETAAAVKRGEVPKGEAEIEKPAPVVRLSPAERTAARDKRKAETAAALKAGQIPKGGD